MRRVERGGAEHPGVHVRRAGAYAEVEVDHPAHADHESRLAAPDHRTVEDHRHVGATLVGVDPVDDRVAADLLLAVERKAHVDRKRALGGELPNCLDEEEQVPLVVGDPARVETAVAPSELEGRRLPQLERVGWLDVEVRVAEDRRRVLRGRGSRNLADDERPLAPRHELDAPARAANVARHPLRGSGDVGCVRRIGAHGRDRDELGELIPERVGRRRHGREFSQAARIGNAERSSRHAARNKATPRSPVKSE